MKTLDNIVRNMKTLVGSALLIGMLAGEAKAQKLPELDLSGNIDISYQDKYFALIGYPLRGNNVIQSSVNMGILKKIFTDNDGIFAFGWLNYGGQGPDEPEELDLGIGYRISIETFRAGDAADILNLAVDYEHFMYPDGVLSDDVDKVLNFYGAWDLATKTSLTINHRRWLNDSVSEPHHLTRAGMTQTAKIGEIEDWTINTSAGITTTYAHDFFGQNGHIGYNIIGRIDVGNGKFNVYAFVDKFENIGEGQLGDVERASSINGGIGMNYRFDMTK